MERKSKAGIVISVCCIVWGVLYFLYARFFPHSLYGVVDMNTLRTLSQEEIEAMKESLALLGLVIRIAALVLLILLTIFRIITQNKLGYSFKDKKMFVYSTEFLIASSAMYVIGGRGIAWIFVILSGIIGVIGSVKDNG